MRDTKLARHAYQRHSRKRALGCRGLCLPRGQIKEATKTRRRESVRGGRQKASWPLLTPLLASPSMLMVLSPVCRSDHRDARVPRAVPESTPSRQDLQIAPIRNQIHSNICRKRPLLARILMRLGVICMSRRDGADSGPEAPGRLGLSGVRSADKAQHCDARDGQEGAP